MCNNCGSTCIPVSIDCLCNYTCLNFIEDLSLHGGLVSDTNDDIRCLMEDSCYEGICSDPDNAIRKSDEFKKLWCKTFELIWSKRKGRGRITKEGYLVKSNDDLGSYTQMSRSEYKELIADLTARVDRCKKDFQSWLPKNNPACCLQTAAEAKNKKGCGCKNPCGCGGHRKYNYEINDFDFI